jgi:tetratricopeptide (TPR) repeat protein
MGTVYVAEQAEPVRRRVALKVIKPGMDTRDVVARFEAERQALAVMEHPNIARVLDGGATEDGRPYFVMELVKGDAITAFCDDNKRTTRQRIELFIPVCQAVQHAHQKGVIHRDLKPSNILVMLQDGTPVPKVIDFGIAKALTHSLTELTLVTQAGQAVGTAAYMSPEQASASSAIDVDTRTDVYALGVTLYELLVGRLPLDPHAIGPALFMVRLASRETNPSTPSAKLTTLAGQDAGVISHHRRTDVKSLQRELRGDLDWIVMKAIDPDRSRRYETVNGLAMDLQRFLVNEPVVARPPTTAYRVSRFVRRHRVVVVAGALVALSLIGGLAAAGVSLVRARRAEALARREAETARRVSDFVADLFRVSDPSEARGNTVTAREILDRGAQRVHTELSGQPEVQARLMETIGTVYSQLGLFGQAQPLLEEALLHRRERLPDEDPEVQGNMLQLGRLAQQQGRFAVAESLYRASLGLTEHAHGPDSPRLVPALNGLGGLFVTRGRFAEGESLLSRGVRLRAASGAPDDADYARLLRNLGSSVLAQKRFAEAEPVFARALVMYHRTVGDDHPDVGRTLSNLGVVYYGLGRLDEAERNYARAEAVLVRTLGDAHPNIASININLGEIAWKRGRLGDAEQRLRRALDILGQTVQPDHPSVATAAYDLANVLRDGGHVGAAEAQYRRALEIRESSLGASSPAVAEVLRDYALSLRRVGRRAEANRLSARADAIDRAAP